MNDYTALCPQPVFPGEDMDPVLLHPGLRIHISYKVTCCALAQKKSFHPLSPQFPHLYNEPFFPPRNTVPEVIGSSHFLPSAAPLETRCKLPHRPSSAPTTPLHRGLMLLFHPCLLHTFLDFHDFTGIELHLQAPISLVLVQPAVGRKGVLLALARHADLHAAQVPAGTPARAIVPNHQPVDLKGNLGCR